MMWQTAKTAMAPYFAVIVVCGVLAACGVSFFAGWNWNGSRWEAKINTLRSNYSKALAQSKIDAQIKQDAEISRVQGVNDVRADELTKLAADAAARPPTIIRVCNKPALPPAGDDQGPNAGNGPDPGAGALPPSNGEGSVTYFDTAPLYAIADAADRVAADLRACKAAWPR